MANRHFIRRNKYGEPELVIRITGYTDIFRFGFALLWLQLEFHAIGRHCMRYVAQQLGKAKFTEFDKSLTGGRVVAGGYHRRGSS